MFFFQRKVIGLGRNSSGCAYATTIPSRKTNISHLKEKQHHLAKGFGREYVSYQENMRFFLQLVKNLLSGSAVLDFWRDDSILRTLENI